MSYSQNESAIVRATQFITLRNVLLSVFGYVFYSIVYQIVYYRFFHPLRKFPGPWWASVTRLWIAYHNVKEDELYLEEDMHRKLGKSWILS